MLSLKVLKFITAHPLNRNHKLRALARFATWQIGSRLINGAVVFDWIAGSKFLVRTSEAGLTGNIYAGLQEFPDMGFLLHVLRPGELFVDVGANVGSYTILACAVIGARGCALEPVPTTYNRLLENIRLNRLEDRVRCLNIGIGREQARLHFTVDLDTANHAVAHDEISPGSICIEMSTLNAVLTDSPPSVIKIDVEGYESPVVEGAADILKDQTLHSVIMELNGSGRRYGYDEARIVQRMSDFGFRTYTYDPFGRELINLNSKHLNEGNTLFIRNEALVLERLRTSPKFYIHGNEF
ncbi:MAG: FkbM family methyltransferase [Steroidobacteraceae bacterium]